MFVATSLTSKTKSFNFAKVLPEVIIEDHLAP